MTHPLDEVFSAGELARAAGVSETRVRELIAAGQIASLDGEFVAGREAVRAGRALANGLAPAVDLLLGAGAVGERPLLSLVKLQPRATGLPLALSTVMHAGMLAGLVLVTTTITQTPAAARASTLDREPVRLVYLSLPGPGGGGGGGGRRQRLAPPKALREGPRKLSSPLPVREPPKPIEPVEEPPEAPPPPIQPEPLPPVKAPVATAAADDRNRPGVLDQSSTIPDSRGPGTGGGVGRGEGTGIGEGDGPGIGPGSGGGMGGGPYRPGSGIEPPRLLREVKPDYTEEARQLGIEGEVVMEIIVGRDGSVRDIRVLQSLGSGLDQRAAAAVRQWRFQPARRLGSPVDVLVEVAVEFRLR